MNTKHQILVKQHQHTHISLLRKSCKYRQHTTHTKYNNRCIIIKQSEEIKHQESQKVQCHLTLPTKVMKERSVNSVGRVPLTSDSIMKNFNLKV